MRALRRIHAALLPDGVLIDTQPVSPHPPIRLGDIELGRLDMSAWAETIAAVDRETARVVHDGLYRLEDEQSLSVTDTYDDGPDLLSYVCDWQGTRIPSLLASTLKGISAQVSLEQEIRLRLYRAGQTDAA